MENEKIFDEATITLMAAIAFIGDFPLIFAWLGLLVPVVGLVVFALVFVWNVLLVAILGLWFIIKSVHSLNSLRELASLHGISEAISYFAVGIVFGLGMLLGLILPVKTLAVLLAAFMANTKMGQILTQIAATAAIGAVTGGAGAVARGATTIAKTGEIGAGAAEAGGAAATAGEAAGGVGATAEGVAAREAGAAGAEIGEGGVAKPATKGVPDEEGLGPKKGTLRELKESLEKIPEMEEVEEEKEEEDDEGEDAEPVDESEDEDDESAELDGNAVNLKKAA